MTTTPSPFEPLETRVLLSAVQAHSADAFIDSIGLNTRFEFGNDLPYNDDFAVTKQKLDDLDIRWLRDKIPTQQFEIDNVLELYNDLGIQTTHIFNRDIDQGSGATFIANELDRIRPYKDAILALEGPNEYDLSTDPNKWNNLRGYVQEIWDEVRTDADFSDYVIVGPSMAQRARYDNLGDIGQWVDYSNIHPYPGGETPTNNLTNWIQEASESADGKLPWATETGYHNALNWTGGNPPVSEDGAADYINRLYLDYFDRGIERTAYYTLWDHGNDLSAREDTFGLLNFDGSEKPAFVALENLIDLVKDPGADFTPGSLDFDLEGQTNQIKHTLLQQQDGTFWLAIWNDVDVYDQATQTDIVNPDAAVTITFNDAVDRVRTYLPKSSTNATATHNNPTSLALSVPDHVLLLEITPSDTTATQPPFIQSSSADGLVVIEAENFAKREAGVNGDRWIELQTTDTSGGGALVVTPDTGDNYNTGADTAGNAAHLQYQINFTQTGTHHVWLRGQDYGSTTGQGDSVHVGLNGSAVNSADRITGFNAGSWSWSESTMDGPTATLNITTPGLHTLDVWMREDGFALDKILLTTSNSYSPGSGQGPAQSAQPGDTEPSPYLSFTDQTLVSYGNQDTDDRPEILNDNHRGNVLRLDGNDWKALAYDLNITSDTVLEFEFRSSNQSEVNAIGIASNNATARSNFTYRLWGTEGFGRTVNPQYNGSGNWQAYTINIGDNFSGSFNYLTFINDNDSSSGVSEFRNIRVYNTGSAGTAPAAPGSLAATTNDANSIDLTWNDNSSNESAFVLERSTNASFDGVVRITLEPGRTTYTDVGLETDRTYHYRLRATNADGDSGFSAAASATPTDGGVTLPDPIDFSTENIQSYGNQDLNGTATVLNGGATLKLEGNTWKAISEPYTVTPDTILQFDFKSDSQGETHGIGLATGRAAIRSASSITLWGPDAFGPRSVPQYGGSGNWQTFTLRLDNYMADRSYNFLTFINDHNVTNPNATSFYRNVRLYEDTGAGVQPPAAPSALNATPNGTTSINLTWTDNANNEDNLVLQRATNPSFSGATSITLAANTTSYTDNGLNPDTTYHYRVKTTNIAGDSAWSNTTSATTDAPAPGTIDFSQETIFSYGNQDIDGTATVLDNGDTLKLEGNTWKAIAESITVTANTILEFDFKSDTAGEVHGIGLAKNNAATRSAYSLTLWGPETYGSRTTPQYDGSGNWQTFQITLDDYLATGSYSYLTFINDHDVTNPNATSFFRNVRVYEGP